MHPIINQLSNWWNGLTGQGGMGDHSGSAVVAIRPDKSPQEVTELLKHAPLMRIACEILAEDIARAWRVHSKAQSRWIDLEEQFDLRDVAEKAMFYSEGYGGAFVIPRFAENVVSVKAIAKQRVAHKNGFLGFEVYAQHQLRFAFGTEQQRQPNGLPMFYSVEGLANVKIHHSWVRPFKGPTALPASINTGSAWGMHGRLGQSRADIIYDDFSRMVTAYSALSHILVKGNIDVLKLKGLAEAISRCSNTAEMQAAMEKMMLQSMVAVSGANTFQPIVIDADEMIERKAGNHTGASDIAEKLLGMFVASTRVPRTRLLGEQSKGMNNSGEADLILHYDRCASYRERKLTPFLNWMDSIVAPGSRTAWEYGPLWDMSEKEKAEIATKQAETDKKYHDMGIDGIDDAIAARLRETGAYALPTTQELNDAPTD